MAGSDDVDILLTNDDGINAPGIRALYNELQDLGTVRVVAPADNQSASGRSLSYGRTARNTSSEETVMDFESGRFTYYIPHDNHELGYAVHGTPCDCVILGTQAFDRPDIVVAGCNPGANIGAFVLSRSGTASAVMEAAFLRVPAVAVSMDTLGYQGELTVDTFDEAGRLAGAVVERSLREDWFADADYFNLNTPAPGAPITEVEVTRPSPVYEMRAEFRGERLYLRNRLWEQMAEGDIPDPEGTDRQAIRQGRASISPLRTPLEPVNPSDTTRLVEFCRGYPEHPAA